MEGGKSSPIERRWEDACGFDVCNLQRWFLHGVLSNESPDEVAVVV
jgi:hypothetical protein